MSAYLLPLFLLFSWGDETVTSVPDDSVTTTASCRDTCEKYYTENPDARPKSLDGVCVDGAVANVTKHFSPVSCMNGAWDGILTFSEKLKAYGMLVENVGTYIRENIKAHREFVKKCDKDIPCKRELARGLPWYSSKKSDGKWAVPDKDVDAYVVKTDIMSLLDQLHVVKNGQRAYCSTVVTAANENARRSGLESFDFAMARYEYIATKDSSCLGTLGIAFPMPPEENTRATESWSQWFERNGVKLQCYPPGKVSELVCYKVAAFVSDPLTLTGVGAVGGKIAVKMLLQAGVRRAERKALEAAAEAARVAQLDAARGSYVFKQEFKADGFNAISVHTKTGQERGTIEFSVTDRVMDVGNVKSHAKKEGVATAAFAEALKRYPKVTVIRTSLAEDNKRIVKEFMAKGMSCIEAMMETPAYKIRKKFGFTKIIKADCPDYENYSLEVAKP